ncbi:hypothetical protein [Zooshikella ganghwensis]|uniref:Uncharacterized protein n=1 Tax=Zooshikella ganghwensis TaxID=202772 RepID=A0A4P9VU34_9GAMM|nr:hypothetical protein [Zooshikella ganghwensis]RDH45490.1 hypothetical protein B9G39_19695 [Zooshikella ganghwensis]
MKIFIRNLSFLTCSLSFSLCVLANTAELGYASQEVKVPIEKNLINDNEEYSLASNLFELSKLGSDQLKDECFRFTEKHIVGKKRGMAYLNKYLNICASFYMDSDVLRARAELRKQLRNNAKLCNQALRDEKVKIPKPFMCDNDTLVLEANINKKLPTLVYDIINKNVESDMDVNVDNYSIFCYNGQKLIESKEDVKNKKVNLNTIINNMNIEKSGLICRVDVIPFETVKVKLVHGKSTAAVSVAEECSSELDEWQCVPYEELYSHGLNYNIPTSNTSILTISEQDNIPYILLPNNTMNKMDIDVSCSDGKSFNISASKYSGKEVSIDLKSYLPKGQEKECNITYVNSTRKKANFIVKRTN